MRASHSRFSTFIKGAPSENEPITPSHDNFPYLWKRYIPPKIFLLRWYGQKYSRTNFWIARLPFEEPANLHSQCTQTGKYNKAVLVSLCIKSSWYDTKASLSPYFTSIIRAWHLFFRDKFFYWYCKLIWPGVGLYHYSKL